MIDVDGDFQGRGWSFEFATPPMSEPSSGEAKIDALFSKRITRGNAPIRSNYVRLNTRAPSANI